MRQLSAGVLLIAVSCYATSVPARASYFDTGNNLWDQCQSRDLKMVCIATAAAYFDMMSALGYQCSQNTVGVTRQQVSDIILRYLGEHPEERHAPAAFSAILALQKAFNCSRK